MSYVLLLELPLAGSTEILQHQCQDQPWGVAAHATRPLYSLHFLPHSYPLNKLIFSAIGGCVLD